jgi:transposase-like protein
MYHKNHQKILRRLISHPGTAIQIIRRLATRRRKVCLGCGCVGCLQIHHTDPRGIRTFRCRECGKTFSELFGTVFYRSKIPLALWLRAILDWTISTGSISAAELARRLDISHVSAWKMLMKIRKNLVEKDPKMFSGILECDETWCGKKANQAIVFGITDRVRKKVRFAIIPNASEKILSAEIEKSAEFNSTLNTDGCAGYGFASIRYRHKVVNHSQSEFARGDAHTNTIERIWGMFKGIVRTIHHGISKKYRKYYLAQFAFRYNYEHNSNLFYSVLVKIFSPMYCLR